MDVKIHPGKWHSTRQRDVVVRRVPVPESDLMQLEIRYHKGGRGRVVWFLDIPRMQRHAYRVLGYFLADKTCNGKEIPEAPAHLKPFGSASAAS